MLIDRLRIKGQKLLWIIKEFVDFFIVFLVFLLLLVFFVSIITKRICSG